MSKGTSIRDAAQRATSKLHDALDAVGEVRRAAEALTPKPVVNYGELETPRDALNNVIEDLEQWQETYGDGLEYESAGAINEAICMARKSVRIVEDLHTSE